MHSRARARARARGCAAAEVRAAAQVRPGARACGHAYAETWGSMGVKVNFNVQTCACELTCSLRAHGLCVRVRV
eukprot:4453025-Pleurochrysis_carterae.AAC.2